MKEKIRSDWQKDRKFFRWLLIGTGKCAAFFIFLGLLEGLIEKYV